MLFNSYAFVFVFFPLSILGFYLTKKIGNIKFAKTFLVLASLVFVGISDIRNVFVLLASMCVNYLIHLCILRNKEKRLFLIIGLAADLVCLLFFKYTDSVFVPLGVSFFTFTQIAFLMETYRGKLAQMPVMDYSVYVTFFPKMIQGPIASPGEMTEQLDSDIKNPFDWGAGYKGLALFILGLSKKVLIADTFGAAVEHGYTNLLNLNTGDAWILMLSYTLQLYFDFSGYCDMAMGAAKMLGFSLPLNFNSPYKASNIVEFWKGWHITLTRFFTKYLYIPLGGNRKGKLRTYCNILIIFLVSGIWHGAGVTFIVWGMLHGVLYAVTKWWQDAVTARTDSREKSAGEAVDARKTAIGVGNRIKQVVSVAVTFLYVNITWIFFRSSSLSEAFLVLKKMFAFEWTKINLNFAKCFEMDEFWYVIKVLGVDKYNWAHYVLMIGMLLVALILVFFGKTAVQISDKVKPTAVNTCLLAVLLVWCILTFADVSSFLYVNF